MAKQATKQKLKKKINKKTPPSTDIQHKNERAEVRETLRSKAETINTHLERADIRENEAFDHRLAASLHLAECKQTCKDNNIRFKTWAEKNVKFGWQNVRKLALIGSSNEPRLALMDLRARNAAAVARHRKTKAPPKTEGSRGAVGRVQSERPREPEARAIEALDAIEKRDDQQTAIRRLAQGHGLKIADNRTQALQDGLWRDPAGTLLSEFKAMGRSDRRAFLDRAAEYDGFILRPLRSIEEQTESAAKKPPEPTAN